MEQIVGQTFLGLMCLGVLMFIGCDEFGSTLHEMMQDEPDVDFIDNGIVSANTEFGFNLFNEIRKTEQDKNIFISPVSISIALAMTLNGAAGETEQAMGNTLQLQGLSAESINIGYAGLHQMLLKSDPKVTLTIANSLWARQGIPFKQDFLQRNTQFFGAQISTLDFNDVDASKVINEWVDTNTNGKIQKIISDEIDPSAVLFLMNAIYFKGAWQTEFDPSMTQDETFYLATGGEKQVPMMSRKGVYPYYKNDTENFQAISLPYGDGRMSMYIFLPSRESDLNSFSQRLNTERWESWISQLEKQEVLLKVPKFKMEYKRELKDTLEVLGMGLAFDASRADFSRMASLETINVNLYIQSVVHKTFVEVNEEGTEAAAATSVGVSITSIQPPPPQFIADRPFFFAIRDNETKTVLFMGTIAEPVIE